MAWSVLAAKKHPRHHKPRANADRTGRYHLDPGERAPRRKSICRRARGRLVRAVIATSQLVLSPPASPFSTPLHSNPCTSSMTIFTSPHGSIALPQDRTVLDDLEQNARDIPDAPYLICGATDRILTYKQVHEQVTLVAAGLYEHGVRAGDVEILLSINTIEYPIIFFALNRLQAICPPSFPQFSARDIAGQIVSTKAKRVIAHWSLLELALESATMATLTKDHVLYIGDHQPSTDIFAVQRFIDFPRALPPLPRLDPDAVVALPFSSGTGSRPKGVLLTARALYAAAVQTAAIESRHPVILGLLPFYHISPLMLHIAAQEGVAMLVIPAFEPDHFLRAITKYKVEKLSVIPPMADFLAFHPCVDKYDLSFVKYAVTAGSPLSKVTALRLTERLGIEAQQGYGMTELAGAVTTTENNNVRMGSVGRLLPNVEMKIKSMDDNDQDLGVNQRGELLFRSPQLMKGYLNNAKATNESLTSDGFLRTGDVGYIDDDGFVFIVDRIKSLMKYMGYHVSASELEGILVHHPLIAEACVVRGFDAQGKEIPKAFIVPKPNAPKRLTRQEVMLYVASQVAPYKRIREIDFVASIPKNPSGKMHRQKLQARANAERNSSAPPMIAARL